MKQVNFRLTEAEFERLEIGSKLLGKSVPALIKELALERIDAAVIDAALELYKNNKIGLKQAWRLSALPFHAFLALLAERDIEPSIPDDVDDHAMASVKALRFEDIFPGKSKDEVKKLVHYFNA